MPSQVSDHASASSPSTQSRASVAPVAAIAPRDLEVVDALRRDRQAACVIGMARGVELVRAVLLRVGPAPGRGEPAGERHPRERAQRAGRVRARRPRPPARFGVDRRPRARRRAASVTTKWWKSSSSSETTTPGADGADPYPPPVGVGGEVEFRTGPDVTSTSALGEHARGDCSGDRLRPAPLRDAHDVARSHRSGDRRDDALRIEDDELGYPWLPLARPASCIPVDVQYPGQTSRARRRGANASAPDSRRVELRRQLPRDYWDAAARAAQLDRDGCRRGGGVPELRAAAGSARSMPTSPRSPRT